MVNEEYQPSDKEEAVLEVLKDEKRATNALIRERCDEFDSHGENVNNYIRKLVAAGWVERYHKGLYDFVEDPREGSNAAE